MWQATRLNPETGEWATLTTAETVAECRAAATTHTEHTFYFWVGEIPAERDAQNRIFEQEFEANGERLSRVVIGMDMGGVPENRSATRCGRCFCVIYANGFRQCEYYYCSVGFCRWVRCGPC